MKKMISLLLVCALAITSAVTAAGAGSAPKRGDVNLDGEINISDATAVQKICAELGTFSDEQMYAADADGDGEVIVPDATFIQMIVAGMIDPEEEQTEPLDPAEVKTLGNTAACHFSAELLKSNFEKGKNTFVSPLSVMEALAMTSNGANGVTLTEMERTLGARRSVLNEYFKAYPGYLRMTQDTATGYAMVYDEETGRYKEIEREPAKLSIANSLWYNDNGLHSKLNPVFVKDALDWYDAEVFATPFGQESCDALNGWVYEKTDHMIDRIVDEMTPDELMYLANAIAFEADWQEPYDANYDVRKGTFTADNGETSDIKLMRSTEDIYISDGEYADGFIKYYSGLNYAFAALLPKEGTKLEDYVGSLTGERLEAALKPDDSYDYVNAYLPEFKLEYEVSLKDSLKAMGMPTAFNPNGADFRRMIDPNSLFYPYISDVLHKTFIDVNPSGTSAAAVTVVVMKEATATPDDTPKKSIKICLDRPFVYMIINTDTMTPIFIGAMENIN